MKTIPTIGGAGRIFEIFVPGMFLLLNFVAVLYYLPFSDNETKSRVVSIVSNPVLGLVVLVVFGYLFGVILRMIRTELADEWSAKYLRFWDKNARREKYPGNLYAYERFPYNGWIGQVCQKHFPKDVKRFYKEIWSVSSSRSFFNLCKVMVISEDERAAVEIYSAESLCRYISGMLYALLLSSIAILATWSAGLVISRELNPAMLIVWVAYFAAAFGMLRHFRFMRIKEVETVFAASYKNREILDFGAPNLPL